MITYTSGDIFYTEMQVLVNPVNTVGVMGKGLAKQFKLKYPEMFTEYKATCDDGTLTTGKLHIFRTADKWILNFPTKAHWRSKSKIDYVERGLQEFVAIYEAENIESIAFPMLGCGLGGLDWDTQVRPLMKHHLSDLPIPIEIYVNE